DWVKFVKDAFIHRLNRLGFIFLSNLDENVILITDASAKRHSVREIRIADLPLTASAYVDKVYICRGSPPSSTLAAPCNVAHVFPIENCDPEKKKKEETTTESNRNG
ncbi:hypothetical protein PMAYCL1PPCAC_13156, partial [Pristionchus mayeri]